MALSSEMRERLKSWIDGKYPSRKEAASALQTTEQYLSAVIAGRRSFGPKLQKHFESLGGSWIYILTGVKINAAEQKRQIQGEIKDREILREVKEKGHYYGSSDSGTVKAQLRVVATVPAGIGDVTDRTDWHEWLPIDFDPERDVVLEISKENGESMIPFLRVGDYAIITDRIKAKPGDLVAAQWGKNAGAVKIYEEQNDSAVLLSYNPLHTPIIIPKNKLKLFYVKFIVKRRK